MKLDKEQEAKQIEEKNSAMLGAMQSQRAQIQDEIEDTKLSNKAMQEELIKCKEKETQLHSKVETSQAEKAKMEKDSLTTLSDPHKFVESAESLNTRQLQWLNYQLGLLVNGPYNVPPETPMPISPYQMPAPHPQMYQYYQYPMMQMYKGPYPIYKDKTED